MKLSKLLLAIIGATILLSALVSSASAGKLRISSQTNTALWRSVTFGGGLFGNTVCEVKISGSLHSSSIAKVSTTLIGYITEGTVLRCSAGTATINQASLPWHRRYRGFTGTLPNITDQSQTLTGAEYTVREPGFVTCTVRAAGSTWIGNYSLSGGVVTGATVSGTVACGEFSATISSERTSNVSETTGGGRLTITLI